jgi:hypothetical protein
MTNQHHIHILLSSRTAVYDTEMATCIHIPILSEEACITRVSGCVNLLRLIFKTSDSCPSSKDEEQSKMDYIQGLIGGLNSLCKL